MRELYPRPEYILEAQMDWRTKGVEVRNRGHQPRRIIPSDVTLHHYRATLNTAFADNRRLHNNQVPNPAEAAGDVARLEPKETITLTREEARALQAVVEGSDDLALRVRHPLESSLRGGHAISRACADGSG